MDAADRAELAGQIQQARADGRRARQHGKREQDCPHTDDQLRTAWLEGWAEQNRGTSLDPTPL